MDPKYRELIEYESPREWEELEVEPGAVLSFVALVSMIALPLAAAIFLLLTW